MKRNRKQFIQKHHISYDPEITVNIYKGEHWIITMLDRRTKNMSQGLIRCLKEYIAKHEAQAVDLN